MLLDLDFSLVTSYTSHSQKARILTESWVASEAFCPSCGAQIFAYENNRPVADFYCKICSEDFELKSKKGKLGSKVSAGAYLQMINRINSNKKPNFFFMAYEETGRTVDNFFIVPKYFFVPEIIERRKPLTATAKRAGWIGSNILFSKIPKAGKVFYVENSAVIPKHVVLKHWQRTNFLKQVKQDEARGWILDLMNCIDLLGSSKFTLKDIYSFEDALFEKYPRNNHIKAKIRQQLQILRDSGYLEFLGGGCYQLVQ